MGIEVSMQPVGDRASAAQRVFLGTRLLVRLFYLAGLRKNEGVLNARQISGEVTETIRLADEVGK